MSGERTRLIKEGRNFGGEIVRDRVLLPVERLTLPDRLLKRLIDAGGLIRPIRKRFCSSTIKTANCRQNIMIQFL